MLASHRRRRGEVFSRTVVLLLLFVAVVGGIAWITQYMPRTPRNPATKANQVKTVPLVKFELARASEEPSKDPSLIFAIWDPKDPSYIQEVERGAEGHFDYPFQNVSGGPLDLGLLFTNCKCSRIDVCVPTYEEWQQYKQAENDKSAAPPKLSWITLEKDETTGIEVPTDAHGIARVNWKANKGEDPAPLLHFKLWYQPKGQPGQRQIKTALTPIKVVAPLMFMPEQVKLGQVSDKVTGRILCWSATRNPSRLGADPKGGDACFQLEVQPVPPDSLPDLWAKMGDKKEQGLETAFRIKSAYWLYFTVYEEKDGKHLGQGHFRHPIALLLDDLEISGPEILGFVRGDLQVGGADDDGKVQLRSFPATLGVKRVIPVTADARTELSVEKFSPSFLKVKLEKAEVGKVRTTWHMKVEVPPSAIFGPLPDDSIIILRAQNAQSRLVRIPVLGAAASAGP